MAKLIQVIEADVYRGSGTSGDPGRIARQYWSVDGQLLAEVDTPPLQRPRPAYASMVIRLDTADGRSMGVDLEFSPGDLDVSVAQFLTMWAEPAFARILREHAETESA